MDAKFGRFCVPEERPFNRDLPEPQRAVNIPESGLYIDDYDIVNLSADIIKNYRSLLQKICLCGDDGQYGSSVEHDVCAVQAIARRIHYGALYVAESKFRSDIEGYSRLIRDKDRDGLLGKLTRKSVEGKIIERVKDKAERVQAEINKSVRNVIAPETIVEFYRDFVIPATKQGEILYLLNRKC
jgi:chorismate mutase